MSSKSDDGDKSDSDVSRFTLDGVVAEMVIEVEDNEQNSPSKSLKADRVKNVKTVKLPKENSGGNSSHDESEDKISKFVETESACEPEKNAVSDETEHLDELEDAQEIKMDENMKGDEKETVKDLESMSETHSVEEETKSVSDRKKTNPKSEGESEDEVESTKFPTRSRTNSNILSKNASLKRGNKATSSSKENDEVPEKRLKKSSEDNTAKKEKKSVSFNPIASKVTLSKRLSLRPIAPKIDLTQRLSLENATPLITTTPTTTTPIRRSKRGRPPKNSPRPTPRPKLPSRGRGRPRNKTATPSPDSGSLVQIRIRNTPIPIKSKPFPVEKTLTSIKIVPTHSKAKSTGNKDAPATKKAEQNQISKAWNLVPDGKLESFPEIKKQVNQAANRALRSLHHTLYGELQSRTLESKALREEILKFKGFPFKKNSEAYEKRLTILKRMSDSSINEIAKILNIKKKTIPNIMAFLMEPALQKPIEIIFCVGDPYQPSMQPIVNMQRMPLDSSLLKNKEENTVKKTNEESTLKKTKEESTLKKTKEESTLKKTKEESTLKKTKQEKLLKSLPARTLSAESSSNESIPSKRKRFPSTKLKFYDIDFDSSKKKAPVTLKPPVLSTKPKTLVKKNFASTIKKKAVKKAQSSQTASLKAAAVKRAKQQAFRNKNKKKLPSSMVGKDKKPISSDLQVRRKALELALEIQDTVDLSGFDSIEENDKFNLPDFEYDTDIKEEVFSEGEVPEKDPAEFSDNNPNKVVTQESEENRSENASSEVTLSSDEAKEAMAAPQKKRFYKTTAIPLKSYPSIKANITNGNYSALQRLHICLFGASDKAVNLKGNLLSFGGFPFKQGSEEWKQKRFLLSLLSKNTLKEYLDLLAIKYDPDEDQHSLISKFMNFLAAPIENLPEDDTEIREESEVETDSAPESVEEEPIRVVSVSKKAPVQKKVAKKTTKAKKPNATGEHKRKRKVLMNEDQVRRLEADLAREQRILERERRLHEEEVNKLGLSSYKSALPKPLGINQRSTNLKQPLTDNQTDSDLLNALLETVYQRRELKEAGAKVSIPNKGGHTRLGELANVKFLVVTANYNDLDVLHHLIYMSEATKSRVRKNILDFAGFNFAEDSPAYQDRMNFLTSLGYDISRRIAFLLGLCPYKSLIAQQDLNELIMYFLMSPCQSKQVPIRHLPNTFFGNNMPDELSALMDKHGEGISISPASTQAVKPQPLTNTIQVTLTENGSTPNAPLRQRAKKSFRSALRPSERLGLTPSISTLQLDTPKRPSLPTSILTPKLVQLASMPAQTSPSPSSIAAQALARGIAKANSSSGSNSQEFYIHQQTPDGHQKTFKLIKLPMNHPLNTAIKTQTPTTPVAPPLKSVTVAPPAVGATGLPPGLILVQNNPTNLALPTVVQTLPLTIGQSATTNVISPAVMPVLAGVAPAPKPTEKKPKDDSAQANTDDSLEEKDSSIPVECSFSDEDAEELHPLEDASPPTDEELYSSIQDIIHSCASLEDITLRNVINQVSAEYPAFDLTPRHHYMKECVKKVIMGT